MKESIGKVVLDTSKYGGKDLYSDGEIEDVILDIVKNHNKSEYNKIIMEKASWAVLYHLSDIRENIVSFIDIDKDSSVLEIGAGCGAITGALSRKAKKVTCVELSKKRSTINAYKNSDCDNVEIKVGNFMDVAADLEEQYDYITLIGVLEYAASYIQAEEPYKEFLKVIGKLLKPTGKIVIAIENKMGMKYWAGCMEDHTGKYFVGIDDYENVDFVKTFSKSGLTDLLEQSGFPCNEFYYPYPDYKLPTRIYSDNALPKWGELNSNMMNFDNDRLVMFDEEKAYNEIVDNEIFPFFSNSFLVIASRNGLDSSINENKGIFVKYSNDRADKYKIATHVDGVKKEVYKEASVKEAENHINNIAKWALLLQEVYGSSLLVNKCYMNASRAYFEFIEGKTLQDIFLEMFEKGDMDGIKKLFMEYVDRITKPAIYDFSLSDDFKKVFGEFELDNERTTKVTDVDLIFSNIVLNGAGWNIIDYEWSFDFPIPVRFVIYRAISELNNVLAGHTDLNNINLFEIMDFTDEDILKFSKMEEAFQAYVKADHSSLNDMYRKFGKKLIPVWSAVEAEGLRESNNDLILLVDDLKQANIDLDNKVIAINKDCEQLTLDKNALTWEVNKKTEDLEMFTETANKLGIENEQLKATMNQLKAENEQLRDQIERIYNSKRWKLVTKLANAKNVLRRK